MIRGAIRDAEWRRDVARRLETAVTHGTAQAVVEAWSASPGEVDPAVHELLQSVRRSCTLVLVTNATDRLPRDLEALGLSAAFDGVVNSSALGHPKPRPEIYRAALELAGVEPSEALFVDDAQANVDAAEALGIPSHRFEDCATFRSWLTERGVLQP